MARRACRILGVLFLLIGVAGFLESDLFGMHLSAWHNTIHLVSGALALAFGFACSENAAVLFSRVLGALYLLLGVAGFVAPEAVHSLLQAHASASTSSLAPDNAVHIVFGLVFLAAGFAHARHPTPRAA